MVPRLGLLLALPLAALSRRTYKVGYQSMTGAAPHYAYDAAQEKYVGAYPDLMDLIAQELDVDTVDGRVAGRECSADPEGLAPLAIGSGQDDDLHVASVRAPRDYHDAQPAVSGSPLPAA